MQTFTNEDGEKFDLDLNCHWDQNRGPVYGYDIRKTSLGRDCPMATEAEVAVADLTKIKVQQQSLDHTL